MRLFPIIWILIFSMDENGRIGQKRFTLFIK